MHEYFIMNYNTIQRFNRMIGYLYKLKDDVKLIMKLNHKMVQLN